MLEILIGVLVGCLFGIFTGLTPGIHINLISVLLVSLSGMVLGIISPIVLCVVIISMAVTHTFLDTIPSTFLGAPDSDTAISVLPCHRMLLEGKGFESVVLTLIGSLGSLILAVGFFPIIFILIRDFYSVIREWILVILIVVSSFLIFREKKSRIWALIVFLLAGCLGVAVLNMPLLDEPLFPLFSGLFGISLLLLSLNSKVNIPFQKISYPSVSRKECFGGVGGAVVAGTCCSFMPGMGPSQAAILASQFSNMKEKGFLILVGGLNTVNMVVSFITLHVIDKARNGAVVAVSRIIGDIDFFTMVMFLCVGLISAGIATFLCLKITLVFSKIIVKVNYVFLCFFIIFLIVLLVFLISGFWGLLVLIVGTSVGMIPQLKGIGKNHLMGSLLIPVMMFFI